ncbi:ComEA family DNA-binding protein [Streptomyces sp. KS 21]|uniref:ComEA family DNA-binding protein n=1 Tax=Streptomyces sp. KS 21 TaxID=2485150 RepID=UPI0010624226|nr:ComEA family DNA-binding protein [Streptomyces sp. KS 21]TDU78266.1 competence protein ComEA [Streptomyces sp. KS 21]
MTLRTRTSHPSGATSGPGRPRFSDGRLRHRRGRARPQHPESAAVRRRAEALLGGSGPPQVPPPSAAGREASSSEVPRPEAASGPGAGIRSVADPPPQEIPLSGAVAFRLAVRERLPLWLQTRCGVEPRTVAAVAVVLVAAVAFGAQQYSSARPQPVTAPPVVTQAPAPGPGAPVAGGGAGSRIVVDVSGKVRDPGVRRLPAGSRVEDALAAAGGVRPGTDTTGLNRARVLLDGEQVVVGAPAQPAPGGPGSGAGQGVGSAAGPLSLGTATVEQLDGLPGVGPVLAQHIVQFRTARGGFRSVEELRQVDGIGERRFADLRKLVRP